MPTKTKTKTKTKTRSRKKHHGGGQITYEALIEMLKNGYKTEYDVTFDENITLRLEIHNNIISFYYDPYNKKNTMYVFHLIFNAEHNSLNINHLMIPTFKNSFSIIKGLKYFQRDPFNTTIRIIENIAILLKCNEIKVKYYYEDVNNENTCLNILAYGTFNYGFHGFLIRNNVEEENVLFNDQINPFREIIINELPTTEKIGDKIESPFYVKNIKKSNLNQEAIQLNAEMRDICKTLNLDASTTKVKVLYRELKKIFDKQKNYGMYRKHMDKLELVFSDMFRFGGLKKIIAHDRNQMSSYNRKTLKFEMSPMVPIRDINKYLREILETPQDTKYYNVTVDDMIYRVEIYNNTIIFRYESSNINFDFFILKFNAEIKTLDIQYLNSNNVNSIVGNRNVTHKSKQKIELELKQLMELIQIFALLLKCEKITLDLHNPEIVPNSLNELHMEFIKFFKRISTQGSYKYFGYIIHDTIDDENNFFNNKIKPFIDMTIQNLKNTKFIGGTIYSPFFEHYKKDNNIKKQADDLFNEMVTLCTRLNINTNLNTTTINDLFIDYTFLIRNTQNQLSSDDYFLQKHIEKLMPFLSDMLGFPKNFIMKKIITTITRPFQTSELDHNDGTFFMAPIDESNLESVTITKTV